MRKTYLLFFVSILLLSVIPGKSQKRTLEDLEAALVIKLCDYITWPTDTMHHYAIGLLTDNEKLVKSISQLAQSIRIKGAPVSVFELRSIEYIKNHQILFVDKKYGDDLPLINEMIDGKGVLIFTENHTLSKDFMFNLLTDERKGMVSFEINRANLIFEGFEVHSDIIELRGSEIDVRELYRQTKNRLEKEEKSVKNLSAKLDIQSEKIEDQQSEIQRQNEEIQNKNIVIKDQSNRIYEKELRENELNEKLLLQEEEIEKKQKLLKNLQTEVNQVNITLDTQRLHIESQLLILDTLNKSIDNKQKIIEAKDVVLADKESKLALRNRTIFLLLIMSMLTLVLLVLVFLANKANNRAKIVLASQKEELEATLEKLKLTQNQLIQSEKMASLGVLVAGIAHEINNPVNFISSGMLGLNKSMNKILELLGKYREKYQNDPQSEDIHEFEKQINLGFLLNSNEKMITNIKSGIDRTIEIVKSLKVFSHENEGKEVTNIHENLDLALTILHNQYKYTIEIVKEYGTIPNIECYQGKINQVFVNILTNAIQAIEDKGVIRIKTWQKDKYVFVKIRDNGCGIPEEIKHKIFDPFFTTKKVGSGTGIGLSLVYNIIQNHDGEIVLNSEDGLYSEFIIKLPIR